MVMEADGMGEKVTVRVWDLPIRVVHWALVGLLGFSWYSAEAGQMEWHRWSGYGATALIVFRLIWGFAGSSTARFASFVRGPAAVGAVLAKLGERRPASGIGHNPLGGWSVIALLLVLAAQVGSGLFAVDIDGLESGPLSDLVSFETGRAMAEFHDLSFAVLQGLVLLHVAAIVFYAVYKRDNLLGAMITGKRRMAEAPAGSASAFTPAPLARFLVSAALAAALAWFVANGLRL